MWEWLTQIWDNEWARAGIMALAAIVGAWIVETVIVKVIAKLASRTETTLDDQIIALLERPIYWSVLLTGLHYAISSLHASDRAYFYTKAGFRTLALILWTLALLRGGRLMLNALAGRGKGGLVQTRTVPLFEILLKTGVIAGGIYMGMLAWHIDVGAWIASAGVLGVAAGFAARDSLANYFAGVFIIADGPYKLWDVIILDDGTRGRVTEIGLRSTRIHTKDGIEINIPNSILGGMKIINASAGPSKAERARVLTSVAYGTDMHRVIEILERCAATLPHLADDHEAQVVFTAFGASALDVEVRVWVDDPVHVDAVRHDLHMRIYEALNEAEIEIPFPQQDLYVKELPSAA